MNRFYQLLLYFHILVVLLQNVWLNIVFYDAVADYGRKYMEYGIENGTVMGHRTKRILRIERKEYQTY